jgi:hypothetical protein
MGVQFNGLVQHIGRDFGYVPNSCLDLSAKENQQSTLGSAVA